jgi:uncharacterized protein YutE (UPF0331/DUF86 family)
MELNDKTIKFVMKQNDITREQATDLWAKISSFNNILMIKYGDTYLAHIDEIVKLTKEYANRVVKRFKQTESVS